MPTSRVQASERELDQVEPEKGHEDYLWVVVTPVVRGKLYTQGSKRPGGKRALRPVDKAIACRIERRSDQGQTSSVHHIVFLVTRRRVKVRRQRRRSWYELLRH